MSGGKCDGQWPVLRPTRGPRVAPNRRPPGPQFSAARGRPLVWPAAMAHSRVSPPGRQLATFSGANHRSKWSFLWPTLGRLRPVANSPLCWGANPRSKWSFLWPSLGHLRPVANSPLCWGANRRSKWSFLWPASGHLCPVADSPLCWGANHRSKWSFVWPTLGHHGASPNRHFFRR